MRTIPLLACLLLLAAGCRDDGTGPSEARVASIRLSRTAAPLDDGATLQLTAEPLDGAGRVLPAGRVRLSWSSSDDAVATVADGLVTGRRPGEARITAAAGKASASAQVTVLPVPQALGAAAGAAQEGVAGMPAPQEIVALLTDRHGGAIAGVAVEFVVVKGGGTVAPATAQTDAQGRARAAWTLGTAAGENAVEARVAGRSIAPALFVAMAKAGAPARLEKLAGDAQQGAAATQLPLPLVVRVTDANGNPVAGASVAWRCSSGGSVAPAVSVTDAAGEARATWLLGPGAGEQGMEAWLEGGPAARVQFSAGAGVGAAARLEKVSGDAQEAVVTSQLPAPVVVRVVDAPGNPLPGVKVAWKLFYGGGTVAPAESVTDAQGYARATWTLGTIMAHHRLEARAVDLSLPPVTFTALARVGAAANLAKFGGDGQESEVGYTLTTPLVVRVTDTHGNPVPGVPVQWSGTGSMKEAEAATDTLGLARGTWVLGTKTGPQTMTATSVRKTVAFSASAHQGPSATVKISSEVVGMAVGETRQLEATVTDLFGNVGDGKGRAITWSSSRPEVATVSASGLLSTVALGEATIAATRDGVSGHVRVIVGRVSFRDLGVPLGGQSAEAAAINAAGQIAGSSSTRVLAMHAFLWTDGVATDLGTLGGLWSMAHGINAAGHVVGKSSTGEDTSGPDTYRAFLWKNGRMIGLGTLGGRNSCAKGINDAGQVVGFSETASHNLHAFLWRDGPMTDLGTLGGSWSVANGINAVGHVVGSSETRDGAEHAFLWRDGVMTDLGTLGGRKSNAQAISAAGQVVGYSATRDGADHAFLWQNGVMTDLGTPGGRTSTAAAISPNGQVVGYSTDAAGRGGAVLWENGTMIDLAAVSGQYSTPTGINGAGQVVGLRSSGVGSFVHAVLWTVR